MIKETNIAKFNNLNFRLKILCDLFHTKNVKLTAKINGCKIKSVKANIRYLERLLNENLFDFFYDHLAPTTATYNIYHKFSAKIYDNHYKQRILLAKKIIFEN